MTLTITVPGPIATQLQRRADEEQRDVEAVALDILPEALEDQDGLPSLEEVVARIQALPPNPNSIRPAQGSLAEALRNAPHDPDFDLEQWKKEWAAVEAEMKAIERANDIAEERG